LRGDITAPAFQLSGCTGSQDDVARLISQLRLINGVTRVAFSDATESNSGAGAGTSAGASSGPSQGCGANGPSFDLVVFFQPVANAGPQGVTSVTGVTSTTSSTGGTQ
ncbi:MAG: hypothetical protein WCD11_35860, partial [Solirubrobacteraceae bacterium]